MHIELDACQRTAGALKSSKVQSQVVDEVGGEKTGGPEINL